ncbi:MAG: glucose-1-phosphate thymidylyltransferase [Candidatus Aenigmatarchaeota archaeon]
MKAIILAAGAGKRLRPLTHTGPKHLIQIAGKPIIVHAIEKLKGLGISEIGIVVGYMSESIKAYLGDGSAFGIKTVYIQQDQQLGIAHAIQTARWYVGDEDFLVYLGDNIIKDDLKSFVRGFERERPDASILLSRVDKPERFGVAVVDNGRIVKLVEKPKQFVSDLALVGIYLFRPFIFDAIRNIKPSWRGELEITDAIQKLLDDGYSVQAKVVDGWWADTGTEKDLLEANTLLLDGIMPENKGTIEDGAKVFGKVVIEKGATIRSGSVVRGPVTIGKDTEIGPDASVGPFVSIGGNCKISHTELQNSIIFNNCEINSGGRLVDSIVGAGSKIFGSARFGKSLIVGDNSILNL